MKEENNKANKSKNKQICIFVTRDYKDAKTYKFYAAFEDEKLAKQYIDFIFESEEFHNPGKFIIIEEKTGYRIEHNDEDMVQVIGPMGDYLMANGEWWD